MIIEFTITDEDGKVLTTGKEEVSSTFSMDDFLNKTVPGWEATVKGFFDKTDQGYTHRFKDFNPKAVEPAGPTPVPTPPAVSDEIFAT